MSDTATTIYNADRTERVRIEYDHDYDLDWAVDGTGLQLYVNVHNRYMSSIGDDFRREFDEITERHGLATFGRFMRIFHGIEVVPVYMLVHGGVRLSTGGFGDPWDSGLAGVAFVSRMDFANISQQEVVKDLVDTVDEVFSGEVYGLIHERQVVRGVRVFDVDGNLLKDEELEPGWDEVDSCWGFVGDEYAESEARSWLGLGQEAAA